MKLLHVTAFLLSSLFAYAQTDLIWAKSFGTETFEQLGGMIDLPNGNLLIVGEREVSEEDTEVLIYEINSTGEVLWEKTILFPDADIYISSIIPSLENNQFLVVGSIRPRVINSVGHNIGKNDYLLIAIDQEGNEIWSETYGGTEHDHAYTAVALPNGYVIAGHAASDDGAVWEHIGFNDYWLLWIDETGHFINSKCYGGSGSEQLSSIIRTSDEHLILSGHSHTFINQGSQADFWIVKMNLVGNVIWEKSYGGTEPEFSPYVLELSNGDFIIAGQSRSNDFDIPMDNHGDYDFFAMRIDQDGAIIWSKSYGGSQWDKIYAIEEGEDETFYLGGFTRSNNGDIMNGHNGGMNDYWITQIDENDGTLVWQNNFGGSDGDILTDILKIGNDLYLGGYSHSNDSDIDEDNHGSGDFWVLKLGDLTTQIKEVNLDETLVYPNPSSNVIYFSTNLLDRTFNIFNVEGIRVLSGKNRRGEIDISHLASGMYYMVFSDIDGENRTFSKFVKK